MENYYLLVLDALSKASSQNTELLKLAEKQLKALETEKGFYSTLMTIVADKNVDVNIRWLGAVCLKNGVDRYWRKCTQNTITNEEKIVLKQKLLTCFNEPVNQIAAQFAIIVAKIARFDCPKEWPDLFPTLLNVTNVHDDLTQQRALLTMHHVVKTLSTKRLTGDRRIFQQLAANIFSTILHQWVNYSHLFLQEVNNPHSNAKSFLERCFLCLKILRKLVVYGFKDPSKEVDAVNLFSLIFQQIKPFIDCRKCLQDKDNLLGTCEKYLILLVKVLRDVLELHPFSFVQFIRPALECCVTFCFTKEYVDLLFERLTVQFLNLIKAILLCQEYKPAKLPEDTKEPLTLEAHNIKMAFFTCPVLSEICHQLVSRYFLLSEEDIRNWEENPEEFASYEGGESWKFSLRPCTEVLFLSFFREFRDTLTPLVVEMTKNIHNTEMRDFMCILRKEAVYNAVGLAAFDLYDEIDFDKWFTDVLIPELKIKEGSYYIIRKRVVWLIGQWVGVKMSSNLRPLLYEVVIQLLNSEENLVVRLTASNTLKIAVDDFEFSTEQFLPFLEASITSLFYLLKEVRECDLKMSVLHVLSFIIERVGSQVRPYAESLMQYLPQLWASCGDHNMLRCAIISCFVHLVQGLGTLSENLHPFLLPMISLSTNATLPPHVYLLEDGLELWWAVLENTSSCSPELLDLGSNLIPLLELSSENLNVCLQIVEAYIILSPKNFLQKYGESLLKTILYIITDMRTEGVVAIIGVIESAFIVFPEEGPVLFQSVVAYVLSIILRGDELPLAMSVYLSLLSRVILYNENCFVNILQQKSEETKKEAKEIFGDLLDIWLERMPFVSLLQRRKLLGLALARLLTSGSDVVHERICGVFLAICEVLNDITKVDSTVPTTDSLVMKLDFDKEKDDEEETEHSYRKNKLCQQDPVYTVNLCGYLRAQVSALQQSVGSAKFEDLMSTVDVETMQQLQEYLRC